MKINIISILFILLFLVLLTSVEGISTLEIKSNASISANNLIIEAGKCIKEMQNRSININRANESLQQALQLYSAQISLETSGKSAQYKLVNQSAVEVCHIKEIALKAQDELILFTRTWNSSANKYNLSSIEKSYTDAGNSFNDERFEETTALIDKGYKTLSDYESSQAILKLFYETTTKNIKYFFIENWKILSVGTATFIILLFIFWKTLKRIRMRIKLKNLVLRRASIDNLIRKIQAEYFEKKTMSETEYAVKIKVFGDMARDVERQLPKIHEALMKLNDGKNSHSSENNGNYKNKKR